MKLKSQRFDVSLSKKYTGKQMLEYVNNVLNELEIYVSHIGSYSRKKYPNSIHWHFKQDPKEIGCLDATFWEEGNEFWIIARNREPLWVKDKAKALQLALNDKL